MAEAALFVLVQIPFGVDVDPVDNNTNMQMIPCHITGSTNLGNSVVFVHRIANLCQKLAAMGIKRTVPAAVIDDQIIAITDMIPRFNDCAGLHRQYWCAVGIGNVQAIVVGGILAGNADILAFAEERSCPPNIRHQLLKMLFVPRAAPMAKASGAVKTRIPSTIYLSAASKSSFK